MIELRWVRVKKIHRNKSVPNSTEYEYLAKELQYRYQINHPLYVTEWSEWQTVPEVEAHEPRPMVTADRPRSST